MSELGDKLVNAIEAKTNDKNRWLWKASNGKEIRMMDMDYAQLQQAFWHCEDMLYNKDVHHPGLYRKLEFIEKAWENANAELLLRYVLHDCHIDTLRTNKDLLDFINQHKQVNNLKNSDYVSNLFDGLPTEFMNVTIDKLLSACLDSLEAFDRRLISDKFLLSLGIWLTNDEKKELTEYDSEGKFRPRKDVIKERLFLNNNANIWFVSSGLSYAEFRALVRLEGRPKFSLLPTSTVKLLRDKILLLLNQDLTYHIDIWMDLKHKIYEIANYKNFTLRTKYDNTVC